MTDKPGAHPALTDHYVEAIAHEIADLPRVAVGLQPERFLVLTTMLLAIRNESDPSPAALDVIDKIADTARAFFAGCPHVLAVLDAYDPATWPPQGLPS